jgi:hypothetical protein
MGRKVSTTIGLICCLLLAMPSAAFPWNQATHAYIAEWLGARTGIDSLNEMWGSVAPDMFIYVFDPALCVGWINDQIQGVDPDSAMKIWSAASTDKEEALAFGFVSHNDSWGADSVAHHFGLGHGYENEGYIITKAKQLLNAPSNPADSQRTFGDVFAGFGMSPDEALLVAHGITEYAVDIRLGSEVDPLLGRKLATAARGETKRFAELLLKAFAEDYAANCFGGDYSTAANALTAAEKWHRMDMIYLGQAISQPEPVAVQLLAEQLVAVLSDLGFSSVPVETVKAAIVSSMGICEDYKAEIDAIIEFVAESLKDHGIVYDPKSGGRGN